MTLILLLHGGAVKRPELEIEPAVALHVTARLKLPVPRTVGVHCELSPVCTDVGLQETETESTAGVDLGPLPAFPDCAGPPHDIWISAVSIILRTPQTRFVIFMF